MPKNFKSGKISRLTGIGTSILKATGKYAIRTARNKTSDIIDKNENIKNLSAKIAATKEIIETMGELKGALMKIGQMISISEDLILPKEISALFNGLQTKSPSMPQSEVNLIFKKNFGKLPTDIFIDFDYQPIASASIGQVHCGYLKDGTKVAIKVQYPKIVTAIKNDFKNIDKIYHLFKLIFPNVPNIKSIIDEIAESIITECDYENEIKNMNHFAYIYQNFSNIKVPKAFPLFSTKEILTMEFMEGDTFEDTLKYSQEERDFLGDILYRSFQYSFYVHNILHTDPQNGNYLFNRDQIILLDYGSTRSFSPHFISSYIKLLKSVEQNDFILYQLAAQDLGLVRPSEKEEHLLKHFNLIKDIYGPYTKSGKFKVIDENPVHKITQFLKSIDMKNRKSPAKELFLLDRSSFGLYTKLKTWKSEIEWFENIIHYRSIFESIHTL